MTPDEQLERANAVAVDRAMRRWVAKHGQGVRLVGADYVSRRLTLPCPEFLASVYVLPAPDHVQQAAFDRR